MAAASNTYSRRWFEVFHEGIDDSRTEKEVEFVCRCAPLPQFRNVLDLCCGMGRHARALAARGYSVIGVDRDGHAIARARELGGGATYVAADIRDYTPECSGFDLIICMSQSFGYYDAATNREVLGRLAAGLRSAGRMILDLWNPEFFAAHEGERDLRPAAGLVRESKRMEGDRLFVNLSYPGGGAEAFEWQLFSPSQMASLARSVGLQLLVCCTDYNVAVAPSATEPRIQFLLELA